MPQPLRALGLVLLFAGALAPGAARGATWSLEAGVSKDRSTEILKGPAGSRSSTDAWEQSYGVSFETDLTTALQFSFDLSLSVKDSRDEKATGDTDSRSVTPSLTLGFAAEWWDATFVWDEAIEAKREPGKPKTKTVESSWGVDLAVQPEDDRLPEVKFKTQGGSGDASRDSNEELTYSHSFLDLVEFSLDVGRDRSDSPKADEDTEDRKYGTELSANVPVSESIKLEVAWSHSRQQGLTLRDDGSTKERTDSLTNGLTSKLSWTVLDGLELGLGRDLSWEKDLEKGTLEVTDTWTGDASYDLALTDKIDLALGYGDKREETRGSQSGKYGITRDYTVNLDYALWENLSLAGSFDRGDTRSWPKAAAEKSEHSVSDTWETSLDASFWDDQVAFTATRTYSQSAKNGTRDAKDVGWTFDLSLEFKGIPQLEFTPKYSRTRDEDLTKGEVTRKRSLEVALAYEVNLGNGVSLALQHTYGRTTDLQAAAASKITRDDSTDLTLSWADVLEGMKVELSMTRSANDEGRDDKIAEIDYAYSASFDWAILANYNLSFTYSQDKKSVGDDTRNLSPTFSAKFLEGLLTIDLEYELDQQLEGEMRDTHRYRIEVRGEF